MNPRPLLHIFGVLSFLLLSFCSNENISFEPTTRKDSSFTYFEKGRNSKEIRDKIANFNKALQSVTQKNDTLIPIILDYKIYYHNRLKKYDSSLYFSDSLINTATAQNDSNYMATGYYRKSVVFDYLNRDKKVFENAFKARQLYLKIGDTAKAGRRTTEMAIAQSQLTDHSGAQQTATEALRYLAAEDSTFVSSAYNTIATAYRNQGFYMDAITEWRNALTYAISTRDSLSNLNNIALALQDQEKYDEAIKIFKNIIERSSSKNILSKARFIDNLAYTKWLRDSSVNVKDELLKATNIRQKKNDRNGLLASYDHLGDYYQNKDSQISKLYADSLLLTARAINSKSAQLTAIKKLIQLSSLEKTRELSNRYILLNDSIKAENIQSKNLFAKIRFDEEQKQKEINNLEAKTIKQLLEAEELKNQMIVLSLGGLLLTVSGGFGFYYFRQKHKKEKLQEVHKTETRISKKIHDELANDIYNMMSSVEPVASSNIMDQLEDIYSRTRDISRENSDIDTGENFITHLLSTLSKATPAGAKLIINGENSIEWKKVSAEKKIVIYRVLQEIMINMKKHSAAGFVAIIFSKKEKFLHINYSDNGRGSELATIKSGNGLRNVENRIFSINGTIIFDSEIGKGLKISIRVPL
ncbi:hypothetical protein SAMN05444483_12213 [Salegentibacter echinorum]|uniref:histidine kinase n=1 Tax=Salegentibacter echinorum TaxID=1073325 RepID=A0A1M5LTS1_SALEC|nr:tetratricopeptide repeat-containing sensor histidine kinase [Salegentibacter echinorum]SHG68524.1 hypothetical protein SAMN05444483_12213 [Salegentibacter echinorum]